MMYILIFDQIKLHILQKVFKIKLNVLMDAFLDYFHHALEGKLECLEGFSST